MRTRISRTRIFPTRTSRTGVSPTGESPTGTSRTGVPRTGVPRTGVPPTGVPPTGEPRTRTSRTRTSPIHRCRGTAVLAIVVAAGLVGAVSAPAAADPGLASAAEAAEYRVIGPDTFEEVDAVAGTGAAINEIDDGKVYVSATPAEVAAIRELGFDVELLPQFFHPDATIQDFPPGYDGYHNYDELVTVVDKVVADHPAIAKRVSFGTSHEGRDLIAVKISDDVEAEQGEPEVVFNAGQHAREHLTVEMAIFLLDLFTDGYGSDSRITNLVDDRVIWILPNVNPDGAEYDIATGQFRSWRKNRQPNSGTSAVGTDLNRNWAHRWGGSGSSGSPSSQTYRGTAPFSAPETAQLRDFVLSRVIGGEQRITANIDFHTYSELVLWPYGYTTASLAPGLDADARDTFVTIGQQLAATNGYRPMQASQLYIASGVSIDWMWADQGIFSYTFEMFPASRSGGGFYPRDTVIARETARNREASLLLAEYADCPWRAIGKEDVYCDGGESSTVFADDFTTDTGWGRDPSGTDTATTGLWERGVPEATSYNGVALQLGTPVAGSNVLATGRLAGSSVGTHDIDGGVTTAQSPAITLPATGTLTLSLAWYLAHLSNSSADDYFRVSVAHAGGTTMLLDQRGATTNRAAAWTRSTVDLTPYAGQTIRLLVQAADEPGPSLVEAAMDDIRITHTAG